MHGIQACLHFCKSITMVQLILIGCPNKTAIDHTPTRVDGATRYKHNKQEHA